MRFSSFALLLCVGVLGCGTGKEPAEVELQKGDAAFEERDWLTAIGCYTESIRLKPDFARAYNKRGKTHLAQVNYDDASTDFTEAIRLDPDDPSSFLGRGTSFLRLEKYDEAIADFTESIRLNPNTDAYYGRGTAYKKQGNKAKADANADFTKGKSLRSYLND